MIATCEICETTDNAMQLILNQSKFNTHGFKCIYYHVHMQDKGFDQKYHWYYTHDNKINASIKMFQCTQYGKNVHCLVIKPLSQMYIQIK